MKKNSLYLSAIFLILILPTLASASDITSTGDWTGLIINSGNLSAGIGSPLTATYESTATQITLDIANTLGNPYDVLIRRSDINWHTAVILSARRTDDGIGPGTVSGGLAYQAIDTVDAVFFSGTDDNSTIHVQLQLTDVTVQVPPDTYSTTITFTVTP